MDLYIFVNTDGNRMVFINWPRGNLKEAHLYLWGWSPVSECVPLRTSLDSGFFISAVETLLFYINGPQMTLWWVFWTVLFELQQSSISEVWFGRPRTSPVHSLLCFGSLLSKCEQFPGGSSELRCDSDVDHSTVMRNQCRNSVTHHMVISGLKNQYTLYHSSLLSASTPTLRPVCLLEGKKLAEAA